ncbi:hypothetical protein EYR41_011859 [Orbilia oligospora]|uniref:Uncharacterized protein n=1 Tax=Orbilia oligospora TaxID=2813651 RepID=A0A8H2HIJ8_ORBOL|nr:hypothetical protein EYR41_011859 [Orbilia oligospora]
MSNQDKTQNSISRSRPILSAALYGIYDPKLIGLISTPPSISTSSSTQSNVKTSTSDPTKPVLKGYFENVDKTDLQRYKEANRLEIAASIASGRPGGLSSRSNNEEKRTPSASRSQETTTLGVANSKALESAAKWSSNSIASGKNPAQHKQSSGSRSVPEHSLLGHSLQNKALVQQPERSSRPIPEHSVSGHPQWVQESQAQQTRHEFPFIPVAPEMWEAQRKSIEERINRLRKTMERGGAPVAELEATPVIQSSSKDKIKRTSARIVDAKSHPQELERKSIPAKQPTQTQAKKKTGFEKDLFFNERADFHLQEWLNESDKGDLATATEHLAVVENMIVEKWGSIKAAPKEYISQFLTCKIMNLLWYHKDQEALQLAKYIEPVHLEKAVWGQRISSSHLVAEILLYMRLKDWNMANRKCTLFLQPGLLEPPGLKNPLDPKIDAADQNLRFWLMAKILKGSGKPVDAKFYKAQVKPGLSGHSWYKWADRCLRQW